MDLVNSLWVVGLVLVTHLTTQLGWPKLVSLFKTDEAKVQAKLNANVNVAKAQLLQATLALEAQKAKLAPVTIAIVQAPAAPVVAPVAPVAPVAAPSVLVPPQVTL